MANAKNIARSAPLKKKHLQLAETRHIRKGNIMQRLFNFIQVEK